MLRLAIRNVFRHRTRTAIALSTIAFGCASMVVIGGFVHDALSKYRESIIHSRLGHLQIARRGYFRHGGSHPFDYLMERHREVAARLLAMQEVTCVAPRLCFQGLLSTGEASVAFLGEGVEAAAERRIGSSVWIEQGEGLSDGDPWTVILGKGLAERLGAKPGDWLIALSRTAQGSINALDLRVRGTFCTSNRFFDDAAARLPLATAQRLLRTDGVQVLVVLLRDTSLTERVRRRIEPWLRREGLEVRSWRELADFYNRVVALQRRQLAVIELVVCAVVALGIANTMTMAIFERTREIGTMMALGSTPGEVMRLFVLEGTLLGGMGGALGLCLAAVAALCISWIGIPMPPGPGATVGYVGAVDLVPGVMLRAFGLSVLAACLSSIWPSLRAARLDPVEALRR